MAEAKDRIVTSGAQPGVVYKARYGEQQSGREKLLFNKCLKSGHRLQHGSMVDSGTTFDNVFIIFTLSMCRFIHPRFIKCVVIQHVVSFPIHHIIRSFNPSHGLLYWPFRGSSSFPASFHSTANFSFLSKYKIHF